jgi:BirA family transcriptional regulator, biotin operon repressor / biotin---[acetyl-CoA-carboxylase] ligase
MTLVSLFFLLMLTTTRRLVESFRYNQTVAFLHRLSMTQQPDSKIVPISAHLHWTHFTEPIASTQDEARRILDAGLTDNACLAVLADFQTAGRGTQGRQWQGETGNLYLTVAMPLSVIPVSPITLLPLQIGVLVATAVEQQFVKNCGENGNFVLPPISVKWPNDVLIGDFKVSGTLIESHTSAESHTTWLLIGIGVNVAHTPDLLGLPGKQGRSATAINDWCPGSKAQALGMNLAHALADWVFESSDIFDKIGKGRRVLDDWSKWAQFGQTYELRGAVVEPDGFQGEQVVVIGIDDSGQLRVRGNNGRERFLSAEYMF